jgi:hypothetical protein
MKVMQYIFVSLPLVAGRRLDTTPTAATATDTTVSVDPIENLFDAIVKGSSVAKCEWNKKTSLRNQFLTLILISSHLSSLTATPRFCNRIFHNGSQGWKNLSTNGLKR